MRFLTVGCQTLDSVAWLIWLSVCGAVNIILVLPASEAVSQITITKLSSQCPHNKYIADVINGTDVVCSKCTVCQKGFQVKAKCSVYNNTICEPCAPGHFNDVGGSSCRPCSVCSPGQYIRRKCSTKRDTSCRSCPKNTYSRYNNMRVCLPCKRCRQHEEMVSWCNGSRDTICGDCIGDHFRVTSSGECLPCSPCPRSLQYSVVPECRDKLGIQHPHICWPDYNRRDYSFDIADMLSDLDQPGVYSMSKVHNVHPETTRSFLSDEPQTEFYMTFIVFMVASAACCVVMLLFFFICLHAEVIRKLIQKTLSIRDMPLGISEADDLGTDVPSNGTIPSIEKFVDNDFSSSIKTTPSDYYISDDFSLNSERVPLTSAEVSINTDIEQTDVRWRSDSVPTASIPVEKLQNVRKHYKLAKKNPDAIGTNPSVHSDLNISALYKTL